MKAKITIILAAVFLMACNSSEQKTTETTETTPTTEKFILKASNMQYIGFGANNCLLANEPDPTKAVVFEKISLGNGKYNLKASNGMFVCDDRGKNDSLLADKTNASDWEQFEIVAVDETKVNIKSSAGKFVTADLGSGGVLVSHHDKASDWELFTIEQK